MSNFTSLNTYHFDKQSDRVRDYTRVFAHTHACTHRMEQNNTYTLSGMLSETNHIKDFETHIQKHLAAIQCCINVKPRVTTTTDECLARLQHCTGSNKGISESTFLSGNFELVPCPIHEYFYVLLYSFLCISVGNYTRDRFQWPLGLRRRSAAARLPRLWVRIPPGHGCLSVVCVVK